MHFFDQRFPGQPGGPPPLERGSVEQYHSVQQDLGLEYTVIIQPNAYQMDNRCLLEKLRLLGDRARGIVTIDTDTGEQELQAMHDAGVRGIRIMHLPFGAVGMETLPDLLPKIATFNWHPIIQLDGRCIPQYLPILESIRGSYIIDHTGKFLEPVLPDDPTFKTLLMLIDRGNCFIKISAYYETSKTGAPEYEDIGILARSLINHAPERLLWASNWPHVGQDPANLPDDRNLLHCLENWCGNDACLLEKILVKNPLQLYDFNSG